MLIAKTNPTGLDIPIHRLQALIYSSLKTAWGLDDEQYKCYPRCYRNKKDNIFIAENYEGNEKYKDAYWDKKLSAVSFFGIAATERHDLDEKINVHLVFMVNVEKLKPGIGHRADEEVRKDVQNVISNNYFGFKYLSTELWAENCLKEYPGSARILEVDIDVQPVHCFRINFELNYSKNDCL